jgi:hypothetical protein
MPVPTGTNQSGCAALVLRVGQGPAECEQAIALRARLRVFGNPAPRKRAVQTAEHLACFAVRGLVRAMLVALLPPLPFRQIEHDGACLALQLIREVRVLCLQRGYDRTQFLNELECDLICDQHDGPVRGSPFPFPFPSRFRSRSLVSGELRRTLLLERSDAFFEVVARK